MPSLPIRVANAFVVAYGVDAVLSLLALASHSLGDAFSTIPLQRLVSALVIVGAFLCLPMLAVCARLPMSLLMALSASVLWLSSGAVPLPLWFALEGELPLVMAAIQLGLIFATLLRIRHLNGGEGWLLADTTQPGPWFSLGHSLRFFATVLFVMLPLVVGYVALSFATWLEVGTEGFVQVNLSGILLADRQYGKGKSEVRLVGMMHIGEDTTYRALTASFVSEDTIVLEEGVSDEDALLGRGLSYERLARTLGLQAQQPIGSYFLSGAAGGGAMAWPVIRNADVDAREFSPETVAYLSLAAGVWNTDEVFPALGKLYQYAVQHPDLAEVFIHDIIELRNRRLLVEVKTALPQYRRIIVPWGALHLPEVERELFKLGFVFEVETRRQVIAWSTLLAALL